MPMKITILSLFLVLTASNVAQAQLCRDAGPNISDHEIVALLSGNLLEGLNTKNQPWNEKLVVFNPYASENSTVFRNKDSKEFKGRYKIEESKICFSYGERENWSCKSVNMCNSGEGLAVFTNEDLAQTSLITSIGGRSEVSSTTENKPANENDGRHEQADAPTSPVPRPEPTGEKRPSNLGKVPIFNVEQYLAWLYPKLQRGLHAKGYDVGLPIVGTSPNPAFVASLESFFKENNIKSFPDGLKAVGNSDDMACFWMDDGLRCPSDCSISMLLVDDQVNFAASCPGYETTLAPRP